MEKSNAVRKESYAQTHKKGITVVSFTVLFLMMVFTSAAALAFERSHTSTLIEDVQAHHKAITTQTSDPSMADPCLPLLKTVRHISPVSDAMDRSRRSAGAATLGLVFGVRFALGPKEVVGKKRVRPAASFGVWQHEQNTGSLEALAVSEYRRCKNEEALEALSGLRWSR